MMMGLLQTALSRLATRSIAAQAAPDSAPLTAQSNAGDTGEWGWSRPARDVHTDTLPHLANQRGQGRHLAQTTAIGAGAIRTNIDRVVGTGLALSASPAAAMLGWSEQQATKFKAKAQAEFSLFADSTDCDMEGRQNFYELQATVLWGVLSSGDIFTLLPDEAPTGTSPYSLRLQLIEADRCGNPMGQMDGGDAAGGIRFKGGKPVAAHIYDRHPGAAYAPGGRMFSGQWVDFVGGNSGRRRLLHHLRATRPGQARGVPYLAPVADDIKRISDCSDAEVKAAIVSALHAVFVETPVGDPSAIYAGGMRKARQGWTAELDAASIIGLSPGEKISTDTPGRPNPNFEPFFLAITGQIGMGLGLPRELLLKQFNASYSASKAALLDAWIYFRGVRTWLARSFCQPVYETWMAEAVLLGRLQAPGFFTDPLLRWAYTRAHWPGDSMGSINPKDEVAAYSAAVDARLVSRERAEWELFGTDWHDTFAAKKTEHSLLKAADMLPVPKAGAAAAPAGGDSKQGETA